ncbi:unnamed protein product [Sphagnum jensenii]|uniref:Uncharacterized protein n=1 Tax=Sphagnum jensenii TaxID=128206 RepID=A0ABP0VEW5_9BRYO
MFKLKTPCTVEIGRGEIGRQRLFSEDSDPTVNVRSTQRLGFVILDQTEIDAPIFLLLFVILLCLSLSVEESTNVEEEVFSDVFKRLLRGLGDTLSCSADLPVICATAVERRTLGNLCEAIVVLVHHEVGSQCAANTKRE